MSLTIDEYEAIPACALEVATLHDTTKIQCKEQVWLYDLCKSISPDKEQSEFIKRPWPKFVPIKSIKRGGEAFLLTAQDRWRNQIILLKVPLPIFELKNKGEELRKLKKPATSAKIECGAKALLALGKNLCRKRLEPPKLKQEKKMSISTDVERFRRSFMLQKQLHKISRQLGREGGYIPDVYEFGEPPCCYFSQEYVEGEDYVEWVRNHSDTEILELFLKLVIFIEKALHGYGVAHCDIAPRNLLIVDNTPILLDFGIAKVEKLPEITLDSAQLGSLLYASPRQLKDSKNRGYLDDLFALGRLLWITLTRRTPSLEGILATVLPDGKLDYDKEAIASLFDVFCISDSFASLRGIFSYSQAETGYTEISEFRADLEKTLYLEQPKKIKCEDLDVLAALEELKEVQLELKKIQTEIEVIKRAFKIMNGDKI